jgi:hypothetical protein
MALVPFRADSFSFLAAHLTVLSQSFVTSALFTVLSTELNWQFYNPLNDSVQNLKSLYGTQFAKTTMFERTLQLK